MDQWAGENGLHGLPVRVLHVLHHLVESGELSDVKPATIARTRPSVFLNAGNFGWRSLFDLRCWLEEQGEARAVEHWPHRWRGVTRTPQRDFKRKPSDASR